MVTQRRRRADLMHDIAMAYSGCRTKNGPRELQQLIDALRRE